jgi:hypothetical protein
LAERDQGLTAEAAAEQEQPRYILALEQDLCLRQFTPRGVAIAAAACKQTAMQPRHGKGRIEVRGYAVVLYGAGVLARVFAAQRQHVMRTGI